MMKRTVVETAVMVAVMVMMVALIGCMAGCRMVQQNCTDNSVDMRGFGEAFTQASEAVQMEMARSMATQPLIVMTNTNTIQDSEIPVTMTKEVPLDLLSGASVAAGTGISNESVSSGGKAAEELPVVERPEIEVRPVEKRVGDGEMDAMDGVDGEGEVDGEDEEGDGGEGRGD